MSSFESSLRSSPKPPTRRLAKDNSGFRSGPNAAPLKQALLNQPAEGNNVSLSAASPGLRAAAFASDSPARTWEPPLSCQRSPLSFHTGGTSEQMFFPLELTSAEYVGRIFRALAAVVKSLCTGKGYADTVRTEGAEGDSVAIFLSLLGHYSASVRTTLLRSRAAVVGDIRSIAACDEHVKVLLSAHDSDVAWPDAPSKDWKDAQAGKLVDMAAVFCAAKAVVSGLVKLASGNPKLGAVAENGARALRELEQLEQQQRLHRVFKDQRMAALGWLWPGASGPAALRSSYSPSPSAEAVGAAGQQSGTNGESKSGAEDEQRWIQVRAEAEEVCVQLQALLQPTTLANVQLFHRLVSIVQDLDVLMRALSVDGEYHEAQRLRDLKSIVDSTVTPQGRSLLDQVKQCCYQAQLLAGELRHYCDDCKARGAFYQLALQCEQVARELITLQKELRLTGTAPFSLLSQPSVVDRLSREGSVFVTSDFLFSEPHVLQAPRPLASSTSAGDLSPGSPAGQQTGSSPFNPGATLRLPGTVETANGAPVSIGSLVIRAGSNAVLNAIRATWPGLTALSRNGPRAMTGTSVPPSPGRATSYSAGSADVIAPHSPLPTPGLSRSMQGSFTAMSAGGGLLSPVPYPASTGADASMHRMSETMRSQQHQHAAPEAGDFVPAENYNEVGFSPTILGILMSFEELQQQLHELLSPAALALTQLIQRLVGFSADFLFLSERCNQTGQYTEGDRLLALRATIEATIDADHRDSAYDLVCGRGRRRLDNVQVLMQQVQVGSKELQRLALRSRAESDFTGAQALDAVAADLTQCLGQIEQGLSAGVFSLLDSENAASTPDAGVEISEHIAREGTGFITSDYVFQFASGREGHSIGSLAIIAGAGAVLRFIRSEWPDLTALSAPLYGQPQLPSHGHEAQWGELSYEMESKAAVGMPGAQSPLNDPARSAMNFRDASSLRLLGFDAASLRLAGFSDIAVVTAGYTAAELRDANFSTEQLRQAGLSDSALRVVGYQTEQQSDILASLFRAAEGGKWKDQRGWRELIKSKRVSDQTPAHLIPVAGAGATAGLQYLHQQQQQQQQQMSHRYLLSGLQGVTCDENSGEVLRIQLCSNNLKGQLPTGLGQLASLTHLVLSDNHLGGALPASLGLLVNLENLHLDGNEFEGEIPKALKSLERLVVLKLEKNRLTGAIPAVLGGLHRLRRLDLSHNALTGSIPPRITQLASLQELLLNDNQLSGCIPEAVGQLTNLTTLHLQANCLQGYVPASIARLSKLTGVNIQQNPDLAVDRLQLQRALPRCRVKM